MQVDLLWNKKSLVVYQPPHNACEEIGVNKY